MVTTAACCATCHGKRERSTEQEQAKEKSMQSIARTSTEDASEDGVPSASDEPKKRGVEVMPHLRKKTQQRFAARENRDRGEARATSLTF